MFPRSPVVLLVAYGVILTLAFDQNDLSGFLNPVGPPGPDQEMSCPGRCNPICSPQCTASCCGNAELSPLHWDEMSTTQSPFGTRMYLRSRIPDPTQEGLKTLYGCQGKQLPIKCKNRSNKIVIAKSFYGRDETTVCKHPVLPYEAYCRGQEDLILEKVKNLCNGENQCSIAVKDGLLVREGTVLCPNIFKYLKVDYICTQHPDIYDKSL